MIDFELDKEWDSESPQLVEIPAVNDDKGEGDEDAPSDQIDGADLFDRIHTFVRRFVCYPSDAASVGHVLWIAHTHLMDEWFSTPRLAVLSPEPGSGKSRLLEITALLVPRPQLSVNSSAAFIMRRISDQENRPTILYDEIDAVYGHGARGNEDLRSMINAGYRRGATVGRCFMEKGKVYTEELATYAAIAMGGLGNLPDTIMSRSIVIGMRKRRPGEQVEPFEPWLHEAQGIALREELAFWSATVAGTVEQTRPVLPEGVVDRNADLWRPLLTIADLAGGRWPDTGRTAALDFVTGAKDDDELPIGIQLLSDIRRCFGAGDRISTEDLLQQLLVDDEAPWGDLQGKKLNPRRLATMLRPYGIKPRGVRLGDLTLRGYLREDFYDAWLRYLPSSQTPATPATGPDKSRDGEDSDVAN